jgi:cobalamin synthase
LKSLAVMNLKILFTLMLCVALEKKRVAFIALAYARACQQTNTVSIACYKTPPKSQFEWVCSRYRHAERNAANLILCMILLLLAK